MNEKLSIKIKEFFKNPNIPFYILPDTYSDGLVNPIDISYVETNFEAFNETYSLLADEKSKRVFTSFLKTKCGHNLIYLCDNYETNTYFNELTKNLPFYKFLDCGAYIGDTVEKFVKFTNGNYEKIYAVEPIPSNREKLENLVKSNNYKNVEIIKKATSDRKGETVFSDNLSGSSIIFGEKSNGVTVELDTIDNILNGDTVSLIKMDIEGSELLSLKGASKTIEKCMPCLAICTYHKAEDLITLPEFIKQFHSDNKHYEFYLRQHCIIGPYDLVLYAIPVKD